MPARAVAFVLAVEAAAVVWGSWSLATQPVSGTELVRVAVLLVLGVGYAETVARTERLREFLGAPAGVFTDQTSIWTFGAALVAPAGWAAAAAALLYCHVLLQGARSRSGVAYRTVFSASTVVLTVLVASAVVHAGASGGPLEGGGFAAGSVLGAGLVYTCLGFLLVATGMWLHRRPPSVRSAVPAFEVVAHEAATLVLGLVAALLLVRLVVLTPLVLLLAVLLHRASLVGALHIAVRTDPKTGVLTSAAWSEQASRALMVARRDGVAVTVLFCDLDHFKAVNDTFGHLVGDEALAAVARCLRGELRERDTVGRFGGEEFVAVLVGLDRAAAMAAAQRLRQAVAALRIGPSGVRVTISIGLVHHLGFASGTARADVSMQALLAEADQALRKTRRRRFCQTRRCHRIPGRLLQRRQTRRDQSERDFADSRRFVLCAQHGCAGRVYGLNRCCNFRARAFAAQSQRRPRQSRHRDGAVFRVSRPTLERGQIGARRRLQSQRARRGSLMRLLQVCVA